MTMLRTTFGFFSNTFLGSGATTSCSRGQGTFSISGIIVNYIRHSLDNLSPISYPCYILSLAANFSHNWRECWED